MARFQISRILDFGPIRHGGLRACCNSGNLKSFIEVEVLNIKGVYLIFPMTNLLLSELFVHIYYTPKL